MENEASSIVSMWEWHRISTLIKFDAGRFSLVKKNCSFQIKFGIWMPLKSSTIWRRPFCQTDFINFLNHNISFLSVIIIIFNMWCRLKENTIFQKQHRSVRHSLQVINLVWNSMKFHVRISMHARMDTTLSKVIVCDVVYSRQNQSSWRLRFTVQSKYKSNLWDTSPPA